MQNNGPFFLLFRFQSCLLTIDYFCGNLTFIRKNICNSMVTHDILGIFTVQYCQYQGLQIVEPFNLILLQHTSNESHHEKQQLPQNVKHRRYPSDMVAENVDD